MKSRHILADEKSSAEVTSKKSFQSGCVLLYLEGLNFQSVNDSSNVTSGLFEMVDNSTVGGECTNTTYQ